MSVEHLSDDEYNTLKSQGVAGLSDEAYQRLKMVPGFNHPYMAYQAKNLASRATSAVPGIVKAAENTAENVPVLGPLAKSAGEAGAYLQSKAEDIRQATQGTPLEMFGEMGKGASELLPSSALGAGLMAAPMLGKAAGAISEALPEASGGLFSPGASKTVAQMGRIMTQTPVKDLEYVLNDPESLSRASALRSASGSSTHSEAAGDIMNQVAEQYGVKTGKDSLKHIPSLASKAAPTLSDASNFTDSVHANLSKIDDLEKLKQIRAGITDTTQSPTAQQASDLVATGGDRFPGMEGQSNKNLSSVGRSHAQVLADDLDGMISDLQKPVTEGGAPTLQDLVSARQVISKQLQAPKYLNPTQAPIASMTEDNLGRIDDAIESVSSKMPEVKPVDVPGYGKVSSLAQARRIYRESKIADNLNTWLPQNNNRTPSVLRFFAGLGTAMVNPAKGAALMAGESPKVWANAIKASNYLKDMIPTTKGTLGALSSLAPERGAAQAGVGALSSLNNENPDEGQGK
jgi:hypothetical protein